MLLTEGLRTTGVWGETWASASDARSAWQKLPDPPQPALRCPPAGKQAGPAAITALG